MGVLAGVSSVLSVLGFAIQLADGIKKACVLWESLQEAPHEVQMIWLCSEVLESLNHLSQKIVFPNTDTALLIKRYRAMKGVIKIEKLQGLQSRLNSAKLTLILARQNSSQLLSMQTYKSQQQLINMVDGIKLDLQELASKTVVITSRDPPDSNVHFEALKVEARALACTIKNHVMRLGFERAMDLAFSTLSNPTKRTLRRKSVFLHNKEHSFSTINTPFGTVNICTTTSSFADGTYKSRTNLIMHPSRLLQLCGVSLGVRIALSKSCGTFNPELKAYRTVPNDSTIFRLCRDGRIDAIRCLFDEGLASPRDTDSCGRTPLMIAASTGQLSTCKFLVNEGADLEVRDIQNKLNSAMELEDIDMIDHLFRSCPHYITEDWIAPSIGHSLVRKIRESDQTHLICCMMNYGMDIHSSSPVLSSATSQHPEAGLQGTITTLLLQKSVAFFRFKTTLQYLGIDIAKFVCDEIQQGPAAAAGWTTQTLCAAFKLNYIPKDALPYFMCLHDCEHDLYCYGRDLSLEILLDKLKSRSELSSGLQDILREREEDLIKFQSIDGRICSWCGELGMSYATENECIIARFDLYRRAAKEREVEVEDSMFLLSI
ncbi:hypothetical protein BHYA_0003g00780 [Botrytis hyacinthi]|uniref:Uncharacterized protein n=1 Tax=Botrytis hyacinthi TaxID=278943 RepID=A0A4Z1H1M4_9HELO|nr:hypothetical protein BHYA_0003g00780 [Botrytis hyacinthi]